jgi:hypothetical protein
MKLTVFYQGSLMNSPRGPQKSVPSDLLDALRAGGDLDVVREGLALVLQALIDAEGT